MITLDIICDECGDDLDGKWSPHSPGRYEAKPCPTCLAAARRDVVEEYREAKS